MRRILVVALLSSLAGCSLDSAGTAEDPAADLDTGTSSGDTSVPGDDTSTVEDSGTADDTALEDSTVADSTVEEVGADTALEEVGADTTVTADTFVADTFAEDTFVADTFVPDTFVPDTFVPDTFVPDTFVADTFVPDTAPLPPTLSCALTAPTTTVNVNLTSEGTIDWANWGHGSLGAVLGAFNRKNGGSAISKGGNTGTVFPFGLYPTRFSWTNGTPLASVTDSPDGEYVAGKNDGFNYDVAGDPAVERTLTAYFSSFNANSTLDVKLSDAAALTYSATISTAGGVVRPQVLTCKFRPATASGKLLVSILQSSGPTTYTSRLAATLK